MIQDPDILLSMINMKLRDCYASMEDLCDDLNYEKEEVDRILNAHGYFYDSQTNQYKAKA